MFEQSLFWEVCERHFLDKWDLYFSKQTDGVLVRLWVRAWDRTFRITHDGRVVYEGTSKTTVEKYLLGGA